MGTGSGLDQVVAFVSLLLFILTANGFLPVGSDNTMRHNKQITQQLNETQHTKLHT
jgi:hypothetical protein